MVDDGIHELTPPPLPTPEDLARSGGSKGATIIYRGRTGEQAINEWQTTHGDINEPTFERDSRLKQTGEV